MKRIDKSSIYTVFAILTCSIFGVAFVSNTTFAAQDVKINDSTLYRALKDCGSDCSDFSGATFDDNTQTISVPSIESITSIKIREKKLKNISDLSKFTELELVDLKLNEIEDISPLLSLEKLTELPQVQGNKISDVSVIDQICSALSLYDDCSSSDYKNYNSTFYTTNQNLDMSFTEEEVAIPETYKYFYSFILDTSISFGATGGTDTIDKRIERFIHFENAKLSDDGSSFLIIDSTKPAMAAIREDLKSFALTSRGTDLDSLPEEYLAQAIDLAGGNPDYMNFVTINLTPAASAIENDDDTENPNTSDFGFQSLCVYACAFGGIIGVVIYSRKR